MKKELAKRLAQCLNPDLNVIHSQTIEVYQHIFERERVSCARRHSLLNIVFDSALDADGTRGDGV